MTSARLRNINRKVNYYVVRRIYNGKWFKGLAAILRNVPGASVKESAGNRPREQMAVSKRL